ncbi:MAG: histidine kinase, partial [Tannerellaceae bacterium]|nr:histidine kinase [Tannerellaceae bacterium]
YMTEKDNKGVALYQLLVNKRYRFLRHLLLILAITGISLSQTLFVYHESLVPDQYIGLIGAINSILYLAITYLHIFILVPHYLLHKHYVTFLVGSVGPVFILQLIRVLQEYLLYDWLGFTHTRSSYFNIVTGLDLVSGFMLIMVCMAGVSMTVLLTSWMEENERVTRLEKEKLETEVAQLKGQISPSLLFKILNKSGVISATQPQYAIDMLYKLGQLLRYQLYDSNRESVLLSAEVKYMLNYLELQKLYNGRFDYRLETSGDIQGIFVPPLLFIPFLQEITDMEYSRTEPVFLNIFLKMEENTLLFKCRADLSGITAEANLLQIKKRLDILYKDTYRLRQEMSVFACEITLQLNELCI